uniref:stress-induced-phosphoprotein 1 isoform X2 n=1 Tax=Ciona intestinalis TaxID=7719 RepID=UPI000EF4D509|nr:stress-induced-phosphoprotein 1 isoform X2 [Ciona intestinalis]|eukprot:XP_026693780.1 stress-induced-phosphoprotein 1 isoform X2 [Ciona intestinalis]
MTKKFAPGIVEIATRNVSTLDGGYRKSRIKREASEEITDPKVLEAKQQIADKIAEELIKVENQEKQKANQKREKRMRQKKKKKEKLQSENNLVENNLKENELNEVCAKGDEKDIVNNSSLKEAKHSNGYHKSSGHIPHEGDKEVNKKNSPKSSSDSDEPEWDEHSAFFSKVAKIKVKPTPKVVPASPVKKSEKIIEETEEQKKERLILKSRQLAMNGNDRAAEGRFNDAVNLFTQAIQLHGVDHRYYGNRSYCYDRLGLFQRALDDATTAVRLNRDWPKAYFRKGRALCGLKRYTEAEEMFHKVLQLDKHCNEARDELHQARIWQLVDMGFSRQLCEVALRKHGGVEKALEDLLSGVLNETSLKDVYVSDEESEEFFKNEIKSEPTKEGMYSLVHTNTLWIGDMSPAVTEQMLSEYFSKYGNVVRIVMMLTKRCAFVTFDTEGEARKAILASDCIQINNTMLILRFPDKAYNNKPVRYHGPPRFSNRNANSAAPVTSGTIPTKVPTRTTSTTLDKTGAIQTKFHTVAPITSGRRECFFWRNRGCQYGDQCRYLHIPQNKGIELS